MGHGILAAIIDGRRIGDVGLVVLQPVGNGTLVLLHLSAEHGHVAAVIHHLVPVVLHQLLRIHVLGIDHQSAGVPVQTVHYVGGAVLAAFLEVVVEHRLHVQRRVAASHRQDSRLFLHDDEPAIFIDNAYIAAAERLLVALGLAHSHLHAGLQQVAKLRHSLAVHLDALTLQRLLDLGAALLHVLQQKLQKRLLTTYGIMVVFSLLLCVVSHNRLQRYE